MIHLQPIYLFPEPLSLCSCGCTPWNVYIQIVSHILQIRNTPLGIIAYYQIALCLLWIATTYVVLQPHIMIFCRICYDMQKELALTLFVFWIFTNNHDASFSFNDFAFFANRFNWWSYLHSKSSFLSKAPFYTGCHPVSGYFSKSVRIRVYTDTS